MNKVLGRFGATVQSTYFQATILRCLEGLTKHNAMPPTYHRLQADLVQNQFYNVSPSPIIAEFPASFLQFFLNKRLQKRHHTYKLSVQTFLSILCIGCFVKYSLECVSKLFQSFLLNSSPICRKCSESVGGKKRSN